MPWLYQRIEQIISTQVVKLDDDLVLLYFTTLMKLAMHLVMLTVESLKTSV